MVYESDFYTTRRPYSRPTVTSYSVTDYEDFVDYPYIRQIQPYHRNIPFIGHKRLVVVQPSAHGWRVKQSSLLGEIDRIYHKVRPSLAYQPKEDYLNSSSIVSFDDETRSIRAKTNDILRKIHTPVPRAQRPLPLPGEAIDEFLRLRHDLSNVALKIILYPTCLDRIYYSHTELPITERITSDNYIDRLLSSGKPVQPLPAATRYDEPRKYSRLGNGRLACVTFAGGRPILRRRNLASVENYIRNDINVLSHYNRFRQAAEKAPHAPDTEYGSIPHRLPTKSLVTGSWKSNAPRRTQSDKVLQRTSTGEENAQETKKKRRDQIEAEAMKEVEEEKRRSVELKRQEELAEQAAAERQSELERKAREEEQERILREEAERMEALKKKEEERKAKEEEEARLAKEEEERKAKEEEAKRKAKEEAERKAEEERKAREEEERRLREAEERRAKEEEERRLREEEEQRQREEEERRLREEEEQRRKEEEERLAREEEERRIKEEEERKAEEERLAREEEEKQKAQQEADAEDAEEKQNPEETEAEEGGENPQPEEAGEANAEEEPVVEEPEEAPAKPQGDEEEDEAEEEDDE